MGLGDIIKNSVIERFAGTDISPETVLINLLITSAIAVYIFLVYRIVTRKTFYSKTFNVSLVALTIIIAAIIITIQSNIVISLGMVGALSIVRFRTAIKDPMDLTFLFWSISVGIICGANLPEIALLESLILTIFIIVLNYLPNIKAPMLLVVNMKNSKTEEAILVLVKEYVKNYKIKSRNINKNSEEIIIELKVKEDADIVREISSLTGVTSVSLISHDGEATI